MSRSRTRRRPGHRRPDAVHKPRGTFHPRVQKVGPAHFGIAAVDPAKARAKWMLADFYGTLLVPPTTVDHNRPAFDEALARLRQAIADHDLRDLLVAIERTGRYHQPPRHAAPSPPPASRRASSTPSPPAASASPRTPAPKPTTPTAPPSTARPSTASPSSNRSSTRTGPPCAS